MPWFAHFDSATGFLRSQGTAKADPVPAGIEVREYPERPALLWSEQDRDFTVKPAPAAISRGEFMQRFTPEERIAIRQEARKQGQRALALEDFMDVLRAVETVRPDHPEVQRGLQLLQAAGILTAERVGAITDGDQ